MSTVLTILPDGFEEVEAVTPIDFLRRAGVQVTLASLHESLTVTGRSGLKLLAETTLHRVAEQEFDCLFLPGGPGVKLLRGDARVLQRVKEQGAVVVDGKLVTSRGAGTAAHFGLELVRALVSPAASQDVARSVCWPNG